MSRLSTAARSRNYLWLEGDSYSAGGEGVYLGEKLATATGRGITVTGVGSGTLQDAAARISDSSRAALRTQCVLIVWDGDRNGYVDVATYLAQFASIAAAMPHSNFLFLPPLRRENLSAQINTDVASIQAGLASTYPSNYWDAQAYLQTQGDPVADAADIAAGVTPRSLLIPGFDIHLTDAAMTLVASQIASVITANGW